MVVGTATQPRAVAAARPLVAVGPGIMAATGPDERRPATGRAGGHLMTSRDDEPSSPEVITPDVKDWTWVLEQRCPECGFVLVPEELATGRMLEVEKILEDK